MKNKALRIAAALGLLIVIAVSFAACSADKSPKYPEPTKKFFVNDFAEVLNESDAEAIYKQGVALQEKTTAQAVVVTVESLDGKLAADYALELGRAWGVGSEEKDNGIVVLLSEADREIYISVGYGLEGALPDSKTGRIIDVYGIPYFENDDFSTGLAQIYNSIANEIYVEYNVDPDAGYIPVSELPQSENEGDVSASKVAISWLVLVMLIILYTTIFGRRGGVFIFGAPRFFGGFHHHGGFGGGSSGGFGGFSGGGGSFGGGGAGRKF